MSSIKPGQNAVRGLDVVSSKLTSLLSAIGGVQAIMAIGVFYVAAALVWASLPAPAGEPLAELGIEFLLIALPGVIVLYGGYRLPTGDLHPTVYPRIVAWTLGGVVAMLVVLALVELNPAGDIERPVFTALLATALGSMGGFAVGSNEARALSRAREAEDHRDRFRTERNLRERIVKTSPLGITIINADRSVRVANERAAEIVGLSREEFFDLEYDPSMLQTTDTEGNLLEEGVFHQVLRTGEAVYDAEREFTRPDGRRVSLLVNGAPLRDASEEVIGVIFAFADITERKQLEDDLKETVDRLEQSNDQLRQFAYAASHDLQEPLRMVSSYLQLLEDQYGDDLDDDAREHIDFAIDGAERMRNMVNDLLTYSRVEQADTAFEPVDCDTVVAKVLADLTVQIENSGGDVVAEPLPRVTADEQQLEQLFQNLVSNALKYGNGPPRVEISAERLADGWQFAVVDDGIGIDPDHTDRIFEVFKRLHHDDEYPGTGIGLAVCQRIVDGHGGDIWVESEPGEGSTFYFTIPTATPQP